jgi:hypothetical protein
LLTLQPLARIRLIRLAGGSRRPISNAPLEPSAALPLFIPVLLLLHLAEGLRRHSVHDVSRLVKKLADIRT